MKEKKSKPVDTTVVNATTPPTVNDVAETNHMGQVLESSKGIPWTGVPLPGLTVIPRLKKVA